MLLALGSTAFCVVLLFIVYLAGVREGRRLRRRDAAQTFTSMGQEYEVYETSGGLADRVFSRTIDH
jgi:hypothetical protein